MVRPAVHGGYEKADDRCAGGGGHQRGLARRRPLSRRMALVRDYMIELVRGAGLRSALAYRAGVGDFTWTFAALKCRAEAAAEPERCRRGGYFYIWPSCADLRDPVDTCR